MARTDSKTQLEALRQQQLELVKKIREAEAKEKKAEQEKQERRKLLAGAVALKELEAKPSGVFGAFLLRLLDQGLKGAADRALFGLPALAKEPSPAPEPTPEPFLMADGGGVTGAGGGKVAAPEAAPETTGEAFLMVEAEGTQHGGGRVAAPEATASPVALVGGGWDGGG